MSESFLQVTELAGDEITGEQLERMHHRYTWAKNYCYGKDVVEAACGTGPGLGMLAEVASSVEAGDFDPAILEIARAHYGDRILLDKVDAMSMPYKDASKDVIILFEAIYYLSDIKKFIRECQRVLRSGGGVLIVSANKDLTDFNPSPFSVAYYGMADLTALFSENGFECKGYGYMRINEVSLKQKILRPIKKMAVSLGLMPKTMEGKKLLKRIVFGSLITMPAELTGSECQYRSPHEISCSEPDLNHKVIYLAAIKK